MSAGTDEALTHESSSEGIVEPNRGPEPAPALGTDVNSDAAAASGWGLSMF